MLDELYNQDTERAFIGALLNGDSKIYEHDIKPEMFYGSMYKVIYTSMVELVEFDVITLSKRLEDKKQLEQVGGRSKLITIANTYASKKEAKKYAEAIKELYIRRTLLDKLDRGMKKIVDREQKLSDIIHQVKHDLSVVRTGDYVVEENPQMMDSWMENYQQPVKLIKTGIGSIDRAMGGLNPTDVGLIMADTNVGKTTLMVNMAVNMAQAGKKILFISLEMTANQVIDKFVSIVGKHNAHQIRMHEERVETIEETVTKIKELPITIVHKGAITSQDVINEAYNRRLTNGVDIVMVDYLQILNDKNNDSKTERLGDMVRAMKAFTNKNEIPILTPVQVDKASTKSKTYIVENVAWAIELAQAADFALYLYEKEKPVAGGIATVQYNIEKDLRLRVVKSRHSAKGTDTLINFDKVTLSMEDVFDEKTQNAIGPFMK